MADAGDSASKPTEARAAASKRAQGRTLAEFYDKDGKLKPAEEKLLEACRTGEFAWIGDERPEQKTDDNTIRPAFLRFLALGGDDDAPVHEQGVQVRGAWIDGDLDLEACRVPAPLFLWQCAIDGSVTLRSADLHGLNLAGSAIRGIVGDGLQCRGSVLLRNGFHSIGEVRLIGANIGGNLDCLHGRFENPDGDALSCDGVETGGGVFLTEKFHATGEVRLIGARIGGNLNCRGGRFEKMDGHALSCDEIETGSTVFLSHKFHATGQVRFHGARIGGNLDCSGGRFESGSASYALNVENLYIAGTLFFRNVPEPTDDENGVIGLDGAHARELADDTASWKCGSALILDGFRYDRFAGDTPGNAESRIAWLDRQRTDHLNEDFRPQPWQQLAHVFFQMGHEEDAKVVRIAMRRRWRQSRWKFRERWWRRALWWLRTRPDAFVGLTVGYGYRPMRALWGIVGVWLIGSLIYWLVSGSGVLAPTDAFVYLDPRIPAECRVDWVHFSGPDVPSIEAVEAAGEDERAALIDQIEADRRSRAEAAKQVGIVDNPDPPWRDICARAVPSEYSVFQPLIYSLDVTLPLVSLHMEYDWAPRVHDQEGAVLHPLATLPASWPLVGGDWGLGHLVRLWEWFAIFAGWTLALLFAASVSGIIKKE